MALNEATIKTNVNNFRNRNSGPIESLRERCRLIAEAFGCEIKVDECGLDCNYLSRMLIRVGKPKEASK